MWTVAAWCELRQDHRTFRVDRIEEAAPLDERFALAPPVTLDDYLAQID
jgi:predicted DNA-binding transcriptional regulator YafY